MLPVKVSEDRHTEAFKYIVSVEKACQYLRKITNNIIPTDFLSPKVEKKKATYV